MLTSGGAPLPNEIAHFFADANLPILQAYGLTENICVAFNRADDFKFGTVGKPMPMCEVKIAADGEILVKSPMMFSGYYKEPEKTAEMFDAERLAENRRFGRAGRRRFFENYRTQKRNHRAFDREKRRARAAGKSFEGKSSRQPGVYLRRRAQAICVALITLNQAEAEAFARAIISNLRISPI